MSQLSFRVDPGSAIVNVIANGKVVTLSPLWLRERCQDKEYLDSKTQQRLFDPHALDPNIQVLSAERSKSMTPESASNSVTDMRVITRYRPSPPTSISMMDYLRPRHGLATSVPARSNSLTLRSIVKRYFSK